MTIALMWTAGWGMTTMTGGITPDRMAASMRAT
jgi:hypothetical protein